MIPAQQQTHRPGGLPPRREPIFNIPAVLMAYVVVLVAIHAIRSFVLTPDMDNWLIERAAFIPARYVHPLAEQDMLGYFLGPIGYSFLHGSWGHLGSNVFFLVVFATALAQRIGPYRFTVLWVISAVVSAFAFAVLMNFAIAINTGASAVVSAMAGASCRFVVPLFGSKRMTEAAYAPRLGILEALTKPPVLVFGCFWLFFNVVLASLNTTVNIAWQAHLAGFIFGYLTFGLFDPPLRRR